MKQDTIHINGLSIGYHSKSSTKLVAKGIHSTIYSGELTCLLGANGVGKSTLLRQLLRAVEEQDKYRDVY